MRRRDVLKALGFTGTTLAAGTTAALLSAENEEKNCFPNLESETFYEKLGSEEGEDLYCSEYDITDTGTISEADIQIFHKYRDTGFQPEENMYCGVEEYSRQ